MIITKRHMMYTWCIHGVFFTTIQNNNIQTNTHYINNKIARVECEDDAKADRKMVIE